MSAASDTINHAQAKSRPLDKATRAADRRLKQLVVPPLLQDVRGASTATAAAASALEQMLRETERLGFIHTAMEEDGGYSEEATSAAEATWHASSDKVREASQGLLSPADDQADARARVTAFLRARMMLYTNWKRWAAVPAEVAAEALAQYNGDPEAVAAAFAYLFTAPTPPTFGGSLFEGAAAKVRAERQWLRDNPVADTPDSYFDAVNDLLMTPAPSLSALAYKLGVFSLDAGIITGAAHFFDEIAGVFPPEDPEAEEDNDGSARQLRAIYQDVITLAGAQPGVYGADRHKWEANRQAYLEAKRTWDACDHAEDEKADSPLWTAYADALEVFQATPPPTVLAMVEQMRAEFEWGGPLARSFQTADCPRSMRDLLDGGDAAEIFTARYYMHALRLARVPSGALQTPASEALQPGFDFSRDFDEVDTLVADWKRHHAEAEFYPGRAARLSRVYSSERSQPGGDDAELVGLLPRWLELERKRDLLIGFSTGGDLGFSPAVRSEFDALTAECERLFERTRELRASGPEGLRVKALLLLDWLPSSDFLGYDETIAQLSRSLVADVLGLPAVDMSAAEWDAWRRASGTSYALGDERDHQALIAEIEAAADSALRVSA